jgi:CBS domain-containing protein
MAFLRQHYPFSTLDDERFRALASTLQIAHVEAGKDILIEGGAPATEVGVVRKGSLAVLAGDAVIDVLEPGEVFGLPSAMTGSPPTATVRAAEDTLIYLIPAEAARDALPPDVAVAALASVARTRIRAAEAMTERARGADPRLARIGALVRRPPITISPTASVAEAATTMRDERVSSLLVGGPEHWAIVTDHDLRSRVVAARASYDQPVGEVATTPIYTAPADTLAGDAALQMLERGIHHLPVTRDGQVIGVVTDLDLLGLDRAGPFMLTRAIRRASTPQDAIAASHDLPIAVAAMVEAGVDPVDAGRVVSLIVDALTQRLLALAIDELGQPPCAYAWLALGSAARHERALRSDQDHALALDEGFDPDRDDPYFLALAERVTAGLEMAGFPRCIGDAMAVHPSMRRTVPGWSEAFRSWIDTSDQRALILSSIGFDYRRAAGSLDVDPSLDAAVADARAHPMFLRMLARVALREAPPTGFVRGLVVEAHGEHAGTLDIKHGGITIVTSIARARSIAAGGTAKDTLRRLEIAVTGGTLRPEAGTDLTEAFRFLWELRLRHQAAQVRRGDEPDDHIDPGTLGIVERSALKEAFRVIRTEQQALALDLGLRS